MIKIKIYRATGIVHGNYWGGGEGAYKAESINAKTRAELLKRATRMLKNGSLDSGMGYESLIGAILRITETETIRKNGKPYYSDTEEIVFIGKLTEKQQDFLMDCLYQF